MESYKVMGEAAVEVVEVVDGMVIISELYRNGGGCWLCGSNARGARLGNMFVFTGEPVGVYHRGRRRTVPTAGLLHERCARTVLHCLSRAKPFLDILAQNTPEEKESSAQIVKKALADYAATGDINAAVLAYSAGR